MNIPSGNLHTGSHGKLVSDLQRELTEAGYNTHGVDGVFGNNTKAALMSFQRAKHLGVDGIAGRQTWTALGGDRFESSSSPATIPSGVVKMGSRGKLVSDLQRALTAAGYNTHGVDGVFGNNTKAALMSFQRAKHLTVDGVAGRQTWTALGGDRYAGVAGPTGGTSSGGHQVTAYVNGHAQTISVVPVGNGQYLRADAAAKYLQLIAAAGRAGFHLTSTSGFRTMAQQQHLYYGWTHHLPGYAKAAVPGYSNHQNGIAMDIGGIGGYNSAAYRWLTAHAGAYGFKNDVSGESWHFDYRG